MISPRSSFLPNALYCGVWLIFVVFVICQCGHVLAEEEATHGVTQEERQGAATESKDESAKCMHGCLRWGKFCNVDPRGVYKCRRRCEKLGEICE